MCAVAVVKLKKQRATVKQRFHSDDDRNVPFQQTTDLVEKLLANGGSWEAAT